MLKKTLIIGSVAAAFFANAQNIQTLKNTAEIYGNNSAIGSARYNAMAGSMGALGGEASAINSNPAGIGVSITNDASITLTIGKNDNTVSIGGSSLNNKINKTDLGNSSAVTTFHLNNSKGWKFVNLGISYSSQSLEDYTEAPENQNIIVSQPLIDSNGNHITGNFYYLGHAYNQYGDITKTSIAVGGNHNNDLYIGGALHLQNTRLEQHDSAAFGLDLSNEANVYEKQYTPFSEQSTGISLSFGVIKKINNLVRLGASVETPTWWSIDRDYIEYAQGSNGYNQGTQYNETRSLSSPTKGTLSAAYVPSKNFALNLDYSIGLTKPKYKVQGDAEQELNDFIKDNYRAVSEVKLGAEYRVKNFRMRGGYSYASSPIKDMTVSAYSDAGKIGNTGFSNFISGSKNTFAVGLGYDFKAFYLDATYQNISSSYKSPFLRGSETAETGYYSAGLDVTSGNYAVSDVKNKRDMFSISLGYKF